jgi:hypothetical protein
MAKYHGNIGFAVQVETRPGIWEDVIEDRPYKGDVLSNVRRWDPSENINDDFTISNRFSVISDAFLYSHIPAMRYIEYMGTKFKISSVNIDRPRVEISVGGVYVA